MELQTVSTSTKNKKSRFRTASGTQNAVISNFAVGSFSVGGVTPDTIENRFNSLKNEWVALTRFKNSLSDINNSEPLRRIIDLGPIVVPFILRDLADAPKHWFYALRVLTNADPIKTKGAGNMEQMRKSWLDWAAKKGVKY